MATVQQYIGYDNLVTVNNLTADSEAAGFPVTNLANPVTSSKWRSGLSTEQYVTIDLNGEPVDYVGIAGHNLGSTECTYRIGIQTADGGAWTWATAVAYPADDRPIFRLITSGAKYGIRIYLNPADVAPQIAVVYVGQAMQMQRGIYVGHTPITYGRDVDVVSGFAESGAFLGRIERGTTYKSQISVKNITPAWYRSTFEPFVLSAKSAPFFYGWRMTDYPEEVGYCWIKGGVPVPENTGPRGYMGVSFNVEGLA